MGRRIIVIGSLVSVIIVGVAVAVCVYSIYSFTAKHTRTPHVFKVDEAPGTLTDELAVETASEALQLEGFDIAVWNPHEDNRSTDPDGKRDKYLARNNIDPNRGTIVFIGPNHQACAVSVELSGKEITCQVTEGK